VQDFSRRQLLISYIGRAAGRLKATLEQRFRDSGRHITVPQWVLLNVLWAEDGVSQKDLVSQTFKDKTNVARILATLEERGLVNRRRDETDRRFHRVYLTEAGRQARRELEAVAASAMEYAFRDIPKKQIEAMIDTLKLICENLD